MNIAELLLCPACRNGQIDNASCQHCGQVFSDDGGTPRLFADNKTITFVVRYVTLEETGEALRGALKRGTEVGASGEVYHLDRSHMARFRQLPPGSRVLEVGCGGGQMRHWVQSKGWHYCGTDVSKTRVNSDLQRFGGPDFLSDAHNLPLADNSFDLVYSAAVTEHLAAPHLAIQEIFRVLKPGGLYLGNGSFLEPWHDESFFHITLNGAIALLLQAGFQPEAVWPSEGYSGYKALPVMDNTATRVVRHVGHAMHGASRGFFALKRMLRGADRYGEAEQLRDLAKTAGAIDWIARKPG